MSLQFRVEWMEAPGVRHAGEAATWARLSIDVGGRPLSLEDDKRKAIRDGFYGSLLPLVEWLVDSWPRLLHERREAPPGDETWKREWRYFHCFRAARRGGAMPDLCLRRHDERTLVAAASADRALSPGMSVRFLRDVTEQIDATDAEAQLGQLIDATLQQLEPIDPDHARDLSSRWEQSRSELARVAGVLGADPSHVAGLGSPLLQRILGDPDSSIVLAVAEGSTAASLDQRVEDASKLVAEIPQGAPTTERWAQLRGVTYNRRAQPWLTGWDAAGQLRRAIGLGPREAPKDQFPSILEARCGWPAAQQVYHPATFVTGMDTVHVQRRSEAPLVVTMVKTQPGVRFRLARCLFYFLFKRAADGQAAVGDSPLLPELSEANAFAAELLAPAEALRGMIPDDGVWTKRQLSAAAHELRVSPMVVRHQVRNRHLGVDLDLT